jgi:hypothetical protein
MRSYITYALWTDLKRRSTWALLLSMGVIGVSTCLCVVLFSVAREVRDSVEAEIIRSGAVNSMDVVARPDREYRKPWSAPPIDTEDSSEALERLTAHVRRDLGDGEFFTTEPSWISPGWVYMFLTHPDEGGTPVAVGISLTSPGDPEGMRIEGERLAGQWVTDAASPEIVLPKKIADRLWPGVMFVNETAWIGITETSICAQATVRGIYGTTQRNYCHATAPVATAIQAALDGARDDDAGKDPSSASALSGAGIRFDRVRLYFEDRAVLLRARNLVEQQYKFGASTPYDRFQGKLGLAVAMRSSAWIVFAITLGTACGTIFCTFLAWVSRRRFEIALLKAQGSGNGWVAGLYMLQSGCAGLLAGGAGVLAGVWLCPVLAGMVSRTLELKEPLRLVVPVDVAIFMVVAAAGISAFAALLPTAIAARQDPWQVLREAA